MSLAIALALAAGTEAFTSSAVGIALRRMAADFSASPDEISWAVTLYLTAYALALPLTAWLSDLLSQRRYLALSIGLYAVASLGCATSGSLPVFLIWRTIQGAAGAAFIARAIFTFTKELRPPGLTRALLILIGGFSLKALGLPFGGLLINSYSWRWIFVVPAVLMLGGALPALAASTEVWPRQNARRPDGAGIVLLGAGLAMLLVALLRGERDEWFASPAITALVALGALALLGFAWRQLRRRDRRHLLPLAILRYRGMSVGVLLSVLAGVMMIGGLYVLPQFFLGIVHT
ncbi:MAG: MFS transporter, partial [Gammaproteobacteria bacterium]